MRDIGAVTTQRKQKPFGMREMPLTILCGRRGAMSRTLRVLNARSRALSRCGVVHRKVASTAIRYLGRVHDKRRTRRNLMATKLHGEVSHFHKCPKCKELKPG